jgi:hypothetical protein
LAAEAGRKLPSEDSIGRKEARQFPVAFAAGAVIVLILAAGAVLVSRSIRTTTVAAVSLPFGARERAYTPDIHFQNIQMARSSNMLNQIFTYVGGTISNDGDRNLGALEATFEFHDQFNQVVLRETRQLIAPHTQSLARGAQQPFQIVLDHVPSDWNQQNPTIRVTGLVLQ